MRHLLGKVSISRRGVIALTALATAASGSLVYSNTSGVDSRTLLIITVPSPLRESLSWSWATLQQNISPASFGFSSLLIGNMPIYFSKANATPSPDMTNETSGVVGNGPKPCCGCLGRDTIANAAARVGPAVVNLSVPRGVYGMFEGRSIGSGTIIASDGTILTCAHVVVDFHGRRTLTKGKVEVTLQDGRSFEGTVLNADMHSDIAIVKINSKTPLPTAKLGSSAKLRPGDWVIAMGCPLSLQNTVTAGIVSCVDRKSSDLGLGGMRREFLQTDCAINGATHVIRLMGTGLQSKCYYKSSWQQLHFSPQHPDDIGCLKPVYLPYELSSSDSGWGKTSHGNSGGPLVNIDGEIVGVNVMKVHAADGLNFSVPIDSVSTIIEHFKKNGRVVRPWLGMKMLDLNDMIVAQLREKDATFPSVHKGILVPMVTPGSPADRAGFHPGDVVVQLDGRPVGSIKEVVEIIGDKIGKPLTAVVKRANNTTAILTVIPEEANPDM